MLLRGGEMKKYMVLQQKRYIKNDGRNTVVRPSDCAVLKKGIVCYLAVKVEFMNK